MKNQERFTKTQELVYELKVSDAMTTNVHTVKPEDNINEVRYKMKNYKISGLPVCKDDKLIGIFTIEDLIRSLSSKQLDCKVEDEMSRNVQVLFSDEPLIHAVNKFERYGFGRFPVIDRETGKLVGIITKGNIIRCLLRKLEIDYHEDEIRKYRVSHIFEDINSDEAVLTLKYSVKGGDFKTAGQQSSKLKKNLQRLNFPPEVVRRVAIAAYEAEMNIVIFTPKGDISAEIKKDRIRVVAKDNGPGISDIELAMQPGYSTAADWVRELGFGAGMGLPNIKKCSDEMRIESEINKGTTLEFIIYVK